MLKVIKCSVCKEEKEVVHFNKGKNKNGFRSECKVCSRKEYRNRYKTLRFLVFDKLGHRCIRCGFSDKRALQIDHVDGGGNKEHKTIKNNNKFLYKVLEDTTGMYQILCANCNWIKRIQLEENPVYEKKLNA